MIYGLLPPRGRPGRYPPGNKDQVSGNCAARFLACRPGLVSVALALELIPETEGRRCTAQQREGEEVSRSAAVVLLRGRAPVRWRNYATATWPYWGGARLRPAHPQTPFQPARQGRYGRNPRGWRLAGSYPVTIRKAAGAVLFSVGWGRSSSGCAVSAAVGFFPLLLDDLFKVDIAVSEDQVDNRVE